MDWQNYLRKIQVIELQVPLELRTKHAVMRQRFIEQFRPGDDGTVLLRYQNPLHIQRTYGRWSFRTADLKSGRKILVPFIEFAIYGLDKNNGTQHNELTKRADEFWTDAHDKAASDYFHEYLSVISQVQTQRTVHLDYAESKRRYDEYLLSPEWKERRNRIVRRDKNQCQSCASKSQLNVHHLTYARIGNEHDDDLVTVCRACHQRIHGKA